LSTEENKETVEDQIPEQEPAAENEETAETAAKPEVKEEKKEEPADEQYKRLYAEFDNYRKRSVREKTEAYSSAKSDAVKKFLPVYDNLLRALAQSTEDEAYRKGVEMIMTQFKKTLEELGVSEIESLGKTFDPNLHNAIMHVDDESVGENEVVEVFQTGFILATR